MNPNQTQSNIEPRRVSALILAAGDGLRLGLGPKAFLEVVNKTLLEFAVDAVAPFADEIIVGIRPADIDRAQQLVGDRCTLVCGGKTRQSTLTRLLRVAGREFCLIHEVARPHVSPELFASVLREVDAHQAVALFRPIPVRDSVALIEDGFLSQSLPRQQVVTMQTPHAYHTNMIRQIHDQAERDGLVEDSTAALVTRAGVRLRLVEGSEENVKITYKQDWPTTSGDPLSDLFHTPATSGNR